MSEILNTLNINPIEEKIYLTLLSTGQLSISELVNITGLKLQEVEKGINNLQTKNLIFINPSILKKYSAIYPLVALAEKTKNSLSTIKSLGNQIDAYSLEKSESLDKIVKSQKENLKQITSSTKEEIRLSTDTSSNQISTELDKLIEDISHILHNQSSTISNLSLQTTIELSKNFQKNTENAVNVISYAVGNIVNSLEESQNQITKSFDESSRKIQDSSNVMEKSLLTSLDNSFLDYDRLLIETREKVKHSLDLYNTAAKDTMNLNIQTIKDNFSNVIQLVNTKLSTYDKQTTQILEERIRNIISSLNEISLDFSRVIKDRLNAIKREYTQTIDSSNKDAEKLFTDLNTQLERLITSKTKTNEEIITNLFKIMKENIEKNTNEAKEEIKAKDIRLNNDLKISSDTTQRKLTEIKEKLTLELTNSMNKTKTDFETSKNNMTGIITRAKSDINNKYNEARNLTTSAISNEFTSKEEIVTNIGSKVVEDIKALNSTSETKSKSFIKDVDENAKIAIGKIEMPAKTLLNKGKQTALKYVQEQAFTINRSIEKAQTGIEDTIIAETSNVKGQFKGFSDKFKESNKTIEKLLVSTELAYRELIIKIKDFPRPVFNTTTIIGKEAVLDHIKNILSRVKSTITLVYPDIKEIHLEELLKTSPRTRIIVISNFDPFKNIELIKKLLAKDNIQLKSLAVGATTKPYYAIGRDGEEGLIGSSDESGNVIAITSNSHAFVEMINTEIINNVLSPKTNKVILPTND